MQRDDIHLEEVMNESIQCDDNIVFYDNNSNSDNINTSYNSKDNSNNLDISLSTKIYERNIGNEDEFKHDVQKWAVKFRIPHNAVNELLLILNNYTSCNFSKDSRTLLHTPRKTNIVAISGGHYYHFGLKKAVEELLNNREKITINETVNLLINIDGLPLSKNIEGLTFWPILCSDNVSKQVYIVGCFCGKSKPTHAEEFLRPFVDEAVELSQDGFLYNNVQVKVCISALICDAPAAAYVLAVKQHTGYNSCRKCTIRGKWIRSKVCFPGTLQNEIELRTDNKFANQKYKRHQIEKSILNEIPNFGLVTNTPLDYMHLICLGIMKRLLWFWLKGPNKVRLGSRAIVKISKILQLFQKRCPNDFVRKPRGLKHALQWKATEYRQFLLYTGPIILKDYLPKKIYVHFLTLHIAVTILVNPSLVTEYLDYAQTLLEHFVMSFSIIYGKQYITYNVHNILHICTDAKKFGPLDMFSAFRFENYMSTIKKHLRKNEKPLEQLARRHEEIIRADCTRTLKWPSQKEQFSLKNVHFDGPLCEEIEIKIQYKRCFNDLYAINCKDKRNNTCILKDGTAIIINNIIESYDNRIYIIGTKLIPIGDVYSSPLLSSTLHITIVTRDETLCVYPISEIAGKLWLMHYKNKLIIFPLLHTV